MGGGVLGLNHALVASVRSTGASIPLGKGYNCPEGVVAAVIFWGGPHFRDGNAPLLAVYAAPGAEQTIGGAGKRRIES
jgi:hypothetical protein